MDDQIRSNEPEDENVTGQHNTAPGPSEFHPKLVEILSSSSGLYGALWPIIIREGSWDLRRKTLRKVNKFFRELCYEYRRSDRAKSFYSEYYGNVNKRPGLPYVLDLSLDVEWRCWGADKAGFRSSDSFRKFCAIGGVDPDAGMQWDPRPVPVASNVSPYYTYIWMSRAKDIVFETSINPLEWHEEGYCGYFGLHGNAKKAKDMYQYMYDGGRQRTDAEWEEMGWVREWI